MAAITEPATYQCALLKSSRKHYEHALELYEGGKNVHGQVTATTETAEASGDTELYNWLDALLAGYDSAGSLDTGIATNIVTRFNEYNQICGWGLEDFDPNDPLGVPGGGGGVIT
jgi:hypothetical protein